MLTHLSIRDVVLIEALDLDFEAGLTALTGETGAGKSIILDALGLALGARSDSGLIRAGAEKLSVAAGFTVLPRDPVAVLLSDQGIDTDEGQVVLRRVVGRDGRSRAFVNDQSVSAGLLRQLGEHLVEVHGQLETHGLLDPATHMDVLDQFRRSADGDADDQAVAKTYAAWIDARDALALAKSDLAQAKAEEEFLRAAVAELDALGPQPGEEQVLAGKRAALRHSEHIVKALNDAKATIAGEMDAEAALRTALGKVARVSDQAAGTLDALKQALERAVIETSEALAQLDQAADGVDAKPDALEKAEERLFALKAAARKYRCSVDELAAVRERMTAQLASVDAGGAQISNLTAKATALGQDYERAAMKLHRARAAAAKKLEKAVAKELPPLKLEKAVFHVAIESVDAAQGTVAGIDRVTFEIAANPGAPPGPLNKVASGGELARVMLALKVVLAGIEAPATMVFDEVDAGISGATAAAVGERLAKLARNLQVLVVTHSPQVAAKASAHWRVTKGSKAGATTTRIETLAAASRREEIARMLAGAKITEEARAAADSLLAGAA
ncbi:MAG: DNA repair protein RecN [Rhodobacteraceae bacterium]|nr:DNA repair protein RecN [Paracoccaceae bacterium]